MEKLRIAVRFYSHFRDVLSSPTAPLPHQDGDVLGSKGTSGGVDYTKDMEEKKKILLNLVETTEGNDESKRGPLAELIEDFHKQYEALFSHYDHLTGKLKKKVNKSKQETEKSSSSEFDSSSDSDSDRSSEEVSKNGKVGDEIYMSPDGLQEELEAAKLKFLELKNALEDMQMEKIALESEYKAVLSKQQDSDMTLEDLKVELQKMACEKSELLAEKEELVTNLENSIKKEAELSQKLEEVTRDRDSLASDKEEAIRRLEEGNQMKLDLERKDEDIAEYRVQIEGFHEKLTSSDALLKQFFEENAELKVKIKDYLRTMKELEDELNSRKEQCEHLETRVQESEAEMQEAERKIKELKEDLNMSSESKDEKILELEVLVEDLKRDLEVATDEEKTAWEKTRTIEVQLRLANQKLRITEQLLSEREESFKIAEMKYQEECKELEDRATRLSQVLAANNEAYRGMIMEISESTGKSLTEMELIMKKFEDNNDKFSNTIFNLSDEVLILKHYAKGKNFESEHLKEQMADLTEKLRNETQQGEMMRDKIGKLETEFSNEKGEKEKLVVALKERDERLTILEEEKRQAIRQLCFWCDEVRSRYDQLKTSALKANSRQRQ